MTTSRASADDGARTRLLAGLPVVERRLQVAGVATAILEGGNGPPLILLHGGIECGGAVWGPVVSQLARSHRLVIPDLPGGRHDRAVPLRIGKYANSTFGWPLRVIDDAGHVPHIEQPEAFLRALSEFIPTPRSGAVRL